MALGLEFPDGELTDALTLGIPTDRGVRAWLRAPGRDAVEVTVTAGGEQCSVVAHPDPEHDWIATIDLDVADLAVAGRRPAEAFEVEALGKRRGAHFAPSAEQPTAFSFAFGSCHQPFEPNPDKQLRKHDGARIYAPALQLLRREEARFLLLVGDQVYSDGVEGQSVRTWARSHAPEDRPGFAQLVDAYRHLYRGYFNERGLRALLDAFPVRMTWDDHDIADSWGSRFIETDEERLMFRAAAHTYREYQRALEPGRGFTGEPPFHGGFRYGDVAFWSLDLRGIRSWDNGTVLGPRQLEDTRAFLDECARDGTRTVFITSSIPLIHFSPAAVGILQWVPGGKGSDVRDRWDAAPFLAERDAFIDLIGRWQRGHPLRQVIVLSGDVHAGAAFRVRDRATGGRFHQWTSSSLSAPGGIAHNIANRLGSRFAQLGERRCEVERIGLDPRNNVATVHVRPLTGGGHRVTFDLHAHDARGGLLPGISASAAPDISRNA
ncbi:MAG: alkaline phosphatase D family protein [Dehalococcoidia bacterium]